MAYSGGQSYSGSDTTGSGPSGTSSASSGSRYTPGAYTSQFGGLGGSSNSNATQGAIRAQQIEAEKRAALQQQQAAAARQPTGQQTAAMIAAGQKAAGYGGSIGSAAGGVLGGLAGGAPGAFIGKWAGNKAGQMIGGDVGNQFIGPNPVIGGGYDTGGSATTTPGGVNQFTGGSNPYGSGNGGTPGGAALQGGLANQNAGLGGGLGGAVGAQVSGQQQGIEEQRRMLEQTQGTLSPYYSGGVSALQQQQAMLGLSGQEAQQAAYDSINVSSGQKFLRDRQEKALLRNSAAIGGLGGGNVRTALQQQAVGFGQQDIENNFGRLGSLSGQGYNAAVAGGQFGSNAAANIANLQNQSGEARASGIIGQQQLEAQKSEGVANILGMFAEPLGDAASGVFDWAGDAVSSWGW